MHDVIFDAVGKRKSAKALRQSQRALTPNGRRISVDDGTPKLLAEDLVLLKRLAEAGEIETFTTIAGMAYTGMA